MRIRWSTLIRYLDTMLVNCANPGKVPPTQDGSAKLQARLEAAINDQDFDGVRSTLAAGARADRPLPSRKHPLNWAVHLENLSIVRLLLRSGADPNQLDGFASVPRLLPRPAQAAERLWMS